jgi:hypothetical protein
MLRRWFFLDLAHGLQGNLIRRSSRRRDVSGRSPKLLASVLSVPKIMMEDRRLSISLALNRAANMTLSPHHAGQSGFPYQGPTESQVLSVTLNNGLRREVGELEPEARRVMIGLHQRISHGLLDLIPGDLGHGLSPPVFLALTNERDPVRDGHQQFLRASPALGKQ